MVTTPLFQYGQVICLRESAVLGFLEQYSIGGLENNGTGWYYIISSSSPAPIERTPLFGERISGRQQFTRYFREDELIDLCSALGLVEDYLTARLVQTQTLRASYCPSAGT